jgi:hypothetical protein
MTSDADLERAAANTRWQKGDLRNGSFRNNLNINDIQAPAVTEEQVRSVGVAAARYAIDSQLERDELAELLKMIGVGS